MIIIILRSGLSLSGTSTTLSKVRFLDLTLRGRCFQFCTVQSVTATMPVSTSEGKCFAENMRANSSSACLSAGIYTAASAYTRRKASTKSKISFLDLAFENSHRLRGEMC